MKSPGGSSRRPRPEAPGGRPVLRWSTNSRLRIVSAGRPRPSAVRAPEVGSVIPRAPRARSFLDRRAHDAALRGRISTYRRTVEGREFEVEVRPRFGSRNRIVGTAAAVRAVGKEKESSSRAAHARTRVSLELAQAITRTAQHAAEIRTRRLEEVQRLTEQSLQRSAADERRARFLADASSLLESTPDPEAALERLGELVLRRFADWWTVQFREGDAFRLAAVRADDPEVQEYLRSAVPDRVQPGPTGLLQFTRPRVHGAGDVPAAGELAPGLELLALSRACPGSFMRVPVRLHGQLVGILALGSAAPEGGFEEQDIRTADDLARRIALARESSRLYQEAQREIALRKQAEGRLLKFNAELERRVSERTALLEDASREANSFAYTVAHDLRAPLRAITGFGQVLLDDYARVLDAEGQSYLERIVAAARRMDELIRDLLEYSRLNRAEITLGAVDLDDLLPQVMAVLAQEREERDAQVSWTPPLGRVRAQDVILAQALRNLISNAIKFVPPGTRPDVHISAEGRDGRLRILVRDNGIGVAPEYHQRIFGMFERLNSADQYPGTGMGLAIVRRAVERLGGDVGVDSTAGEGSTFWIDLPAAPAAQAPSSDPAPGSP